MVRLLFFKFQNTILLGSQSMRTVLRNNFPSVLITKFNALTKVMLVLGIVSSTSLSSKAWAASELDQSFVPPPPPNLFAVIGGGFTFIAQTFTAGLDGFLTAVNVSVATSPRVSPPVSLRVQILEAVNGVPVNSVLGSTTLEPGESAPPTTLIPFSNAIPIEAGKQYAIVVDYPEHTTGVGNVPGNWRGRTENPYPDGSAQTSNDLSDWLPVGGAAQLEGDLHFQTYVETLKQIVEIDIKPGNEQNNVNICAQGVLPVAILSSESFDATEEVDPATIGLAGASVKTVGKDERPLTQNRDANKDGITDLVVKILIEELHLEGGDTEAELTGRTFEGKPIEGTGAVTVKQTMCLRNVED